MLGGGEKLLSRVWEEGLMASAWIGRRLIQESEGAFSHSHRALWRMSFRCARHDIKLNICSSFLVLLYCEIAKLFLEPKCVWDSRQKAIRRAGLNRPRPDRRPSLDRHPERIFGFLKNQQHESIQLLLQKRTINRLVPGAGKPRSVVTVHMRKKEQASLLSFPDIPKIYRNGYLGEGGPEQKTLRSGTLQLIFHDSASIVKKSLFTKFELNPPRPSRKSFCREQRRYLL
ncbi:hypothetical protein E2320_009880 [Naja naja]|nr:hypothetical protein E2320_009880 [Naja naja]